MINLAKQNQYVEFAEKDSEGHNIAEKIDEITADVDSIVGFDGELTIEYQGAPVINFPDGVNPGLYRGNSISGTYDKSIIRIIRATGSTYYVCVSLLNGQHYSNTIGLSATSIRLDIVPSLYYHVITITPSGKSPTYYRIISNKTTSVSKTILEAVINRGMYTEDNGGANPCFYIGANSSGGPITVEADTQKDYSHNVLQSGSFYEVSAAVYTNDPDTNIVTRTQGRGTAISYTINEQIIPIP